MQTQMNASLGGVRDRMYWFFIQLRCWFREASSLLVFTNELLSVSSQSFVTCSVRFLAYIAI